MLVTQKRPRVLRWFHAGPLLYGDWGTSRLYVLGLALFFAADASFFYLFAIGGLMAAVAWAYTIVCRSYPDGGGVYTAARDLNPTLSVIGATLLLCGYLMTAAISVVEALHYFGVPDHKWLLLLLSVVIIALIGGINWLGAKSAGTLALIIAGAALIVSGLIFVLAIPYVPAGLTRALGSFTQPFDDPWPSWVLFTKLCLALAGVEAVANMTGLMKHPVEKTAKRTLLPVLAEVVVLNLFFCVVFLGLSSFADRDKPFPEILEQSAAQVEQAELDYSQAVDAGAPEAELAPLAEARDEAVRADAELQEEGRQVRDIAMKRMAIEAGTNAFGERAGFVFGKIGAIVFGLLLLSATNTAVMAMVSVLFAMGKDDELPRPLTKLNYSGVPWVGLIVACVVPVIILAITLDVVILARLYIVGVCGAITTNVLCCAVNSKLEIKPIERLGLWSLGTFLAAVTLTIIVTRPEATLFAGVTVGSVLITRQYIVWRRARGPEPVPTPELGWLMELKDTPFDIDPAKPKVMLAARGRYQADFAIDFARRQNAVLFAIFVRTFRVLDTAPDDVPTLEADQDAQEALGSVAVLAKQYNVPFVPIYVASTDIVDEILDYTVTFGCTTLIMGKSHRRAFARALEGDVVTQVVEHLPDDVALITRDATPHPMPAPPNGPSAKAEPEREDNTEAGGDVSEPEGPSEPESD